MEMKNNPGNTYSMCTFEHFNISYCVVHGSKFAQRDCIVSLSLATRDRRGADVELCRARRDRRSFRVYARVEDGTYGRALASRRLTTVLVVRISRSPVRTVCELATLVHHVGCLHAMPWAWRKAHSLRRLRRTLIRRVAPRSRAPPLTLAARPRTTHPSARWAPLRPMPWRSGAPRRRH